MALNADWRKNEVKQEQEFGELLTILLGVFVAAPPSLHALCPPAPASYVPMARVLYDIPGMTLVSLQLQYNKFFFDIMMTLVSSQYTSAIQANYAQRPCFVQI